MKSTFKLFRIFGIEVGVHYTWLFIVVFFSWSLAQLFADVHPDWSAAVYWTSGIVAALLIFVSVLLHELAHSLVARSRGLPVHSITLFILGGVSNLEEEPKSAGVEFSMAIVGPGTSILIGVVCYVIASVASGHALTYTDLTGAALTSPVLAILGYEAVINLFLGIFNLLPGFPLDGGRVLRSIVWQSTGNLIRATNVAAGVGQFFGWLMIAVGVVLVFTSGNLFSGIWLAFIGWFLNSSADASRKEVTMRERLSHVFVRDILGRTETIGPATRISELVNDIFTRKQGRAVPVCDNGKLLGIVTVTDVRKVPQDRWPSATVTEIMTTDPLYTVEPSDTLSRVLELIARHDINQVIVKQAGGCAGLLGRADIIRYLQFSREMGLRR